MSLPQSFRKMVVARLTTDFRKAVEIQTVKTPKLSANSILVRNKYVGINASDINFTAGKYTPNAKLPMDIGFEAIGEVVAAGEKCQELMGKSVAHMSGGVFTEYQMISPSRVFLVPDMNPKYMPLLVSGVTAKLALDKYGRLKPKEKVLITAAAGGTGQIAVQLAKLAGCHVIGTCSSDEKCEFLRSIGCDHAINVKTEDLNTVLKDKYRNGIDVVYESVGGSTYDVCVNRLAKDGRLIVIGYISGYQDAMGVGSSKAARAAAALPVKLLMKSASVCGFFLLNHPREWNEAFKELLNLFQENKISVFIDQGENSNPPKEFQKLEGIADAVDYMYSRKSRGKVLVDLKSGEIPSKY